MKREREEEEEEAAVAEKEAMDEDEEGGGREGDDEPMSAEEVQINEEYKVWKKNTPFLYDLVITHALAWPSLTVEWMPDARPVREKGFSEHRLLLGTHAAEGEQNFLLVARARLPVQQQQQHKTGGEDEEEEAAAAAIPGGYGPVNEKVEITQRIPHAGDVNRARHMPQNPAIVATKAPPFNVFIFDLTKHPSEPGVGAQPAPQLRLGGHSKDGYGLAWAPLREGLLASCSDDGVVCLWDVNAAAGASSAAVDPLHRCQRHNDVAEDVAWHAAQQDVFASVGDDRLLCLWDARDLTKPTHEVAKPHGERNCNAVSWNPVNEFVLATGGSDANVALWDVRSLAHPVHILKSHKDEVFQVAWSRRYETILASSSTDRRVMVWDLSKIGDEQTADEAEDGPPELLFIHGGHTSRVSEFSWNPTDPWTIASTADDNVLQIWQMAETIFAEEDAAAAAAAMAEASHADLE